MKKDKKPVEAALELIGGIYIVERFKDGTERREEIDGETILKLVLTILRDAVEAADGTQKTRNKH